MTGPDGAPIPVTVRLAEDVDMSAAALRDAVSAAFTTRLRQLGLPGRAEVAIERDGDGLQILVGSSVLGGADRCDLAARPLPLVVQTCLADQSNSLAIEQVVDLLWASARPSEHTGLQPQWFARLVRAVVWAGGYVGNPGPLADATRAALADEARSAAVDVDTLAEQVMRPAIREVTFAAADTTLPRVFDLLQSGAAALAAVDGSAPEHADQVVAFRQLMTEVLGALASIAPPMTLVADPEVPAGYVSIRLCGVDLGSLPVPEPNQAIACVPPATLENLEGFVGPVGAGVPGQSQAWSLVRVGSAAERAVRAGLQPIYLHHLAWGTAQFLGQHRHWLPSVSAVQTILNSLVRSSPYGYSVWFARAILSDEQITSILRMLLFFGVPLTELPMALRDVLLGLREQLPAVDGTLMTAQIALAARERYNRRAAGEAWDAVDEMASPKPEAAWIR